MAWAYLWTRYATINWAASWFAAAFAAEALLLIVAGTFGKSTGEMSLNRPSGIWLTWHLPGIMLAFLVFGQDAVAVVVLSFTTGILQFFVIFWLMVALATWMKRIFQWIAAGSRPPVLP